MEGSANDWNNVGMRAVLGRPALPFHHPKFNNGLINPLKKGNNMAKEMVDLGNTAVGSELQMLLVGAEKSGKSELATTAPGNKLFLDFDMRASALAGRKGVYAFTYRDPANTLAQPDAFTDMLDTMTLLENSRSLLKLGFKNASPEANVDTLVFDSCSTIANAARNYVLYNNPKELAHVITGPKFQFRSPRNWHGWTSEMEMVEKVIIRALGIPGLNVIVTLHETKEEAEDSTEEAPKYTGEITVFPVRYRILLKYFNEVWRLTRPAAGPPLIQCNPGGVFSKASSSLRILTPSEANIAKLVEAQRAKTKV